MLSEPLQIVRANLIITPQKNDTTIEFLNERECFLVKQEVAALELTCRTKYDNDLKLRLQKRSHEFAQMKAFNNLNLSA